MKHFILLLCFFLTANLYAQKEYSKNRILKTHYQYTPTSDLGLKNSKKINAISTVQYRKKSLLSKDTSDEKVELDNQSDYKFSKGKIIYQKINDIILNTEFKSIKTYTYKNKLVDKIESKDFKGNKKTVYTFTYDANKNLTKLDEHSIENNQHYLKLYKHNNTGFYSYYLTNDGKEKVDFTYKTDAKGNIIERNKKAGLVYKEDKIFTYTYNSKSQVIKIVKKEVKGGVEIENSRLEKSLKYNSNNEIIEEIGKNVESDFSISNHFIYTYDYDKFGNWIARYKFSTYYGYSDLNDENYKTIEEVFLRKITYKNGDITGHTNYKNEKTQNYLSQIEKNNPFKTKKAPKKGVFWIKSGERAVKVYDNGNYIGKQLNLLVMNKNIFYVNDSVKNKMYVLKDFVLKPKNTAFYKATNFASNDEVVWFRSSKTAIKSYKNGRSLVKKLNYFKIFGKQFFMNDSTTNSFYKLKDFGLKEIDGEFEKAIKIDTHNDVLWIKLESGNYTIIKNGKNITNSIKMTYAKNPNNVLIKENGVPKYVMINAKNASINNFNKAMPYNEYLKLEPNESVKEVIPNGFLWRKNEAEQFYIYKNGKIDPSKLYVAGFYEHQFVYDIDNNTSYMLEDFNNKETNKYYTINILKGNAFYYRTTDNKIGIFKNGKAVNFKGSKYMDNGIDVKAFDKNGIDTYILKDYKNSKVLVLGEVVLSKN